MAVRAIAKRLACIDRQWAKGNSSSALARNLSSSAVAGGPQDDAVSVDVKESRTPPSSTRRKPRSLLPDLFSPFGGHPTSLMHMMDTVDKLFDSAFSPLSTVGSSLPRSSNRIPWDVMEDDKCFKLRVDMPGVNKDEIKVAIENGDLTLGAEHQAEDTEDEWSSRSYGSYNMRIKLPENVDKDALKAEYNNGVLKVTAPKVEGKSEKIDVQVS